MRWKPAVVILLLMFNGSVYANLLYRNDIALQDIRLAKRPSMSWTVNCFTDGLIGGGQTQ